MRRTLLDLFGFISWQTYAVGIGLLALVFVIVFIAEGCHERS